jgi:GMP synthase PP-ATPase subunit
MNSVYTAIHEFSEKLREGNLGAPVSVTLDSKAFAVLTKELQDKYGQAVMTTNGVLPLSNEDGQVIKVTENT